MEVQRGPRALLQNTAVTEPSAEAWSCVQTELGFTGTVQASPQCFLIPHRSQ